MPAFIRPLSNLDLDRCSAVESAAFPPSEAATYEKIEYRLSNCQDICYGLFLQNPDDPPRSLDDLTVLPATAALSEECRLVAHVISTKTNSLAVVDQDMAFPPTWKADPAPVPGVGHQPSGRTVALHSLAVSPNHQRLGLGSLLMQAYLEQLKKLGNVDRVALLTYDRLVPYYEKLGFTLHGKSASTYAGVSWNDLTYEFSQQI